MRRSRAWDASKRSSQRLVKRLPGLRVRPPGIEWKTGRKPKAENGKIENGPRPKMAKNGPKMAKKRVWGHVPIFSPILGLLFPHFGPWAVLSLFFLPIFSDFRLSACFPFYTRRPDSQSLDMSGIAPWEINGMCLMRNC